MYTRPAVRRVRPGYGRTCWYLRFVPCFCCVARLRCPRRSHCPRRSRQLGDGVWSHRHTRTRILVYWYCPCRTSSTNERIGFAPCLQGDDKTEATAARAAALRGGSVSFRSDCPGFSRTGELRRVPPDEGPGGGEGNRQGPSAQRVPRSQGRAAAARPAAPRCHPAR